MVGESRNAEAAYLWKMLSVPFSPCQISHSAQSVIQVLKNLVKVAVVCSPTKWYLVHLLFFCQLHCEFCVSQYWNTIRITGDLLFWLTSMVFASTISILTLDSGSIHHIDLGKPIPANGLVLPITLCYPPTHIFL